MHAMGVRQSTVSFRISFQKHEHLWAEATGSARNELRRYVQKQCGQCVRNGRTSHAMQLWQCGTQH